MGDVATILITSAVGTAELLLALSILLTAVLTLDKFTLRFRLLSHLRSFFTHDLEPKIDALEEDIAYTRAKIDALEVWQLKSTIVSKAMPLSERVAAGERYLALNQNGAIAAQVEVLRKRYQKKLTEQEENGETK